MILVYMSACHQITCRASNAETIAVSTLFSKCAVIPIYHISVISVMYELFPYIKYQEE